MNRIATGNRSLGKRAAATYHQIVLLQSQAFDREGVKGEIFLEMWFKKGEALHPRVTDIRVAERGPKGLWIDNCGVDRSLWEHLV
jgi:hypothetical protein